MVVLVIILMVIFTFGILVRTHRRLSLALRLLGRDSLGSRGRVGEARSSSSRGRERYIVIVSVVIVLFVVVMVVKFPWGALKG